MDSERLNIELNVLQQFLHPTWITYENGTRGEWLYLYAPKGRGNDFTLQIDLRRFPYAPPPVFIDRMLYDRHGNPLDKPDHFCHTLESERGRTQICYYRPTAWQMDESLWMVYTLGSLWLQAYVKWVSSGRLTIDEWIDRIRKGVEV